MFNLRLIFLVQVQVRPARSTSAHGILICMENTLIKPDIYAFEIYRDRYFVPYYGPCLDQYMVNTVISAHSGLIMI